MRPSCFTQHLNNAMSETTYWSDISGLGLKRNTCGMLSALYQKRTKKSMAIKINDLD